ncbi:DUF1254 domain-containing protein [Reichenbachiella carrageenanivorans]|uniref:DUF1254 domain-containing protein n=1 Tax=Reichenbachiella carrageenanivorans TaxID=2979869 RepID=A0ABY6CYL7_9BACT|nr:DUF1254 domain-containing protein [Reichenbachiella carrageenanivorans]UXX79007.1 DUF1254 domain-containing protein [Reichenbachiella carrageenanivorans]
MKKITITAMMICTIAFTSCNNNHKTKSETKETEQTAATQMEVTKDNYVKAETDWNCNIQQNAKPINEWLHKEAVTMENQTIIRSNADVIYSLALVDVSKGATFSIPERENGAMQMMQLIDENHFTRKVVFAGETATLSSEDLTGGDYVYILARTRISDDMEETKRAQESMVIDAKSAKPYEAKGYKAEDVEAFRNKLIKDVTEDGLQISSFTGFGTKPEDVNEKDYLHCAAMGWGGLPPAYAQYTALIKGQGSDAKNQTITFPKPDLDYENGGFFSITTYNDKSWIAKENFYISMDRMKDNGDGTVTVDFNSGSSYSVDVVEGWNASLRLYLPNDPKATADYINEFISIAIAEKK